MRVLSLVVCTHLRATMLARDLTFFEHLLMRINIQGIKHIVVLLLFVIIILELLLLICLWLLLSLDMLL